MTKIMARPVGTYLRVRRMLSGKPAAVNISSQLSTAENVLILLPQQVEQYSMALNSLKKLCSVKANWTITVVSPLKMVGFIDKNLKVKILPFSVDDLNVVGLPRPSIKQLLLNNQFDLALDFGLKFDLISVALVEASGAAVKICIDNSMKTPFFNFVVRVDSSDSVQDKYDILVKYVTQLSETPTRQTQPVKN